MPYAVAMCGVLRLMRVWCVFGVWCRVCIEMCVQCCDLGGMRGIIYVLVDDVWLAVDMCWFVG